MGLPNEVNSALIGAAAAGGYRIEDSLRFRGGQSLSRASVSTPTQGGISFWIKFNRNFDDIFAAVYDPIFQITNGFSFNKNTYAKWYYRPNSSGAGDESWDQRTNNDIAAWYHVLLKFNSSSSTSFYLNGNLVGTHSFSISSITDTLYIGRTFNAAYYAQFYLAEFHWVVGGSVNVTDFGEFDDNGVWRPIQVSGLTYGTQGFYLDFSDPSNLGTDRSGNGNNLTPSGFTTSGTGTDVFSDTPTNNFATFNPLEKASTWNAYGTGLSNGNLQYGTSSSWNTFVSTIGFSSGKWYFELEVTGNSQAGIVATDWVGTTGVALADGGALGYNRNDGNIYEDGNSGTSYGNTFTGTHTLGIAVDADNDKFYFAIDNTWQNSANPSSGTGGYSITMGSKPWRFAASAYQCTGQVANFGQRDFAYTPPTGFKALNTSNLSAPDIADGSDYFDAVLWNGDGTANRAFTNVLDFQPNFSWVKSRSNDENHVLQDSVRGLTGTNGLQLNANNTNTEGDNGNGDVGAYTSSGFTLSDGTSGSYPRSGVNRSGYTYVGWFWKEGTTPGFDIVTYTGNGWPNTSGTQYISHGLGVKPDVILIKDRDRASDWLMYHSALGATYGMEGLNDTNSAYDNQDFFQDTEPTSSNFRLGNNSASNWQNDKFIAYLWADVPGFSKFGSYIGNSSDDGIFIYLGFKPRWFLVKSALNTADDWVLMDSYRSPINVMNDHFAVNHSYQEVSNSTETNMDFLSNGIKLRDSNGKINASGSTYIYMAFAEHPLGGDGVSPATAR